MSLDEQVVRLCAELCGQYPFMSEHWRTQVPVAVGALKPLLCGPEYKEQLDKLLADTIEDTRTGRTDAEIEDFIRDAKQAKAEAAAKQNADDTGHPGAKACGPKSAATSATPLQLLKRVWYVRFEGYRPWDECFTIDHSLPYEVVEQIAGELQLTIEEVSVALECWRSKMVEAVDAVTADCMVCAKKLAR